LRLQSISSHVAAAKAGAAAPAAAQNGTAPAVAAAAGAPAAAAAEASHGTPLLILYGSNTGGQRIILKSCSVVCASATVHVSLLAASQQKLTCLLCCQLC
jgi:sulfite reductase alpha subunit-like flavoprotein